SKSHRRDARADSKSRALTREDHRPGRAHRSRKQHEPRGAFSTRGFISDIVLGPARNMGQAPRRRPRPLRRAVPEKMTARGPWKGCTNAVSRVTKQSHTGAVDWLPRRWLFAGAGFLCR